MDKQLVSFTIELTRWSNLRAYVAPKDVMPYIERNLPVLEKGHMRGTERWTEGQVFPVRREHLSVDTVCFVT